eukprot:m.88775 g.88775  ORF g.88775 m.88775 type:complete len:498 (-) comp14550_c0_seq1:29-1522(-)
MRLNNRSTFSRLWSAPLLLLLLLVVPCVVSTFQCTGSDYTCPTGDTCCGAACCPSPNAVCCGDGLHCCAEGFRCEADRCVAEDPIQHPYDPWMPLYNLCHGPFPLLRLTNVVDNTDFLYYSNVGNIEKPSRSDIEMAVIVVHGTDRNADEYYCSLMEAAQLQSYYKPESIAVFSPWFLQVQDNPPEGVVYWGPNTTHGSWRSGRESEPGATPHGLTISSYSVLDRMLTALNSTKLYPNLRQVTFVGHSAGGQMVHRYAFAQRIQQLGAGIERTFRYVAANPSSYVYLDARRWIQGQLVIPPEPQIENCSSYNEWKWGIDGGFPKYMVGSPERDIQHLVQAYPGKNVIYLLGLNDTCNEQLKPGCESHGLAVTCMDMFDGRYRLERGRFYYEFLKVFYGRQIHNATFVPNIGHDHALMFQSSEGLHAIFAPAPTHKSDKAALKRATGIVLGVMIGVVLLAVMVGSYRYFRAQHGTVAPYQPIKSGVQEPIYTADEDMP